MKYRRAIFGTCVAGVLIASAVAFWPSAEQGVSRVQIGFSGYCITNGSRSLLLVVTNNSSCRISLPGDNYALMGMGRGTASLSSQGGSVICGGMSPAWWQFRFPQVPSIAPGRSHRFTVPVREGEFTWKVRVRFHTIPAWQRMPYALQRFWPHRRRDQSKSFEIESPSISPPDSTDRGVTGAGWWW